MKGSHRDALRKRLAASVDCELLSSPSEAIQVSLLPFFADIHYVHTQTDMTKCIHTQANKIYQ